jgi:biotin operon repressor
MKQQVAYIDEFGDSSFSFDKPEVSSHFIVSAILIDLESESFLEQEIDVVRKKYFQTGEMKSSKVGDSDNRRLLILNELSRLHFKIYAVVVDKKKLYGQGFRYKQSFYKKLHSLVDRELYKLFPNLQVTSDEHGTKEFMEGFIAYINKNHIPDLFNQSGFRFIKSHHSQIIQLADFISGTLGRCFDDNKKSPLKDTFINTLKPNVLDIFEWPYDRPSITFDSSLAGSSHDPIISELSINLARQFVAQKENSKVPMEIDQTNCLKYLLFYFLQINNQRFVSTFEIKNHLDVGRIKPMSIHYFRSKVIAKLRDQGVLISSSPAGYKLPTSEKDLYEFINQSNTTISPMIARIAKCRDRVKIVTKNHLDILNKPEYSVLKRIIDDGQRNFV